ncbi:HCP-like protein [Fistulina hepatica ATCC 64428]|uniref:HCP-like protein n=1 Tax=Fistulina hepatica ATCC 64428 TaxID=1128425 RepID=A0A0D7AFW5_9AGAR|nr:HCP-like protein [Fistulina hepatica ATCC 64428]
MKERPHVDAPADNDHAEEAEWALNQALSTLSTLTASPPHHTLDPTLNSHRTTKSLISSLLPSIHGHGPFSSVLRVLSKIQNYSPFQYISFSNDYLPPPSHGRKAVGKAVKVIDLLQHSAELGNMDAVFKLGQLSLFPPTDQFPLDPHLAYELFYRHASQTGNATSQSILAFFYATGYYSVVPVDQARAQLYYMFAANGGDKGAQMAMGYRYWSGIGTHEDCSRAVSWYESASEQTMAMFLAGPPGGRTLPQTGTRLSDLVGGVYGPGASVASTGLNSQRPAIKAGLARTAGETWEDVLEYYIFNADRGETDFAYRLGKIFYQGSIYASPGGIASGSEGAGAIPRNYELARHYFLYIARQVWPRDPPNPLFYKSSQQQRDTHTPVGYAAASAAYLGRMYLRGEGVRADPAVAKMWFQRGADYGDRECHNMLGVMYRDALIPGSKPDMKKALNHFGVAAGQELAEAQVNIGKYHYERGDLTLATSYFEAAIRQGSPFEAYYYLADIHSAQAATPGVPPHVASSSCAMAVSFHKLVAERGVWDNDLLHEAEVAWMSGTRHGKEVAMLKWWIAAECGSETAQSNLAYVLDQDRSVLRLTRFSPITPSNDTARLALTQWARAAAQRNVDALVKVGDYYYHDLGVPPEAEATRLERAAKYYQSAADTQMSALAMWNLGWMYENGVGVPQDFHLAKRHYDLALETNSEAYLPVVLSLTKLYMRSIWRALMGDKDGLSLWGDNDDGYGTPEDLPLTNGEEARHAAAAIDPLPADANRQEDDGPWYMGKAREEYQRKRGHATVNEIRGENEDPIQWARDRHEQARELDDDFFDGAMRDTVGEDFSETMLLITLCLMVSALIYFRMRLMERMRQEHEQREGRQNENVAQPRM